MTTALRSVPHPSPLVEVAGDTVTISDFAVDDADLASLLRRVEPEDRAATVARALAIGARGLISMGVGIDLDAIDGRVGETIGRLTADAERRLSAVLDDGRRTLTEAFDPEHRSSVVTRVVSELNVLRDGFLGSIDPQQADSHTNAFLIRLAEVIGPDGALEHRILAALDPRNAGSALAELLDTTEARFADLRDLIIHERGRDAGRTEESMRGTAQGVAFEDEVEAVLRSWAAAHGGCLVERTGRTPGALSAQSAVGDFVVTLPEGHRIVVEAKNQANLVLGGKDGVLSELDRAIANRQAVGAVLISRRPAFPQEVGRFGAFGNRVLAVDEGDGTMVTVALGWARAAALATAAGRERQLDVAAVVDRVHTIRRLAESLRGARTTLTDIRKSVDGLSERLGDLRTELLDQVADMERALATA